MLASVNMEVVPVGNPGNAGELSGTSYGPDAIVGSVSYPYHIGKYEVTCGQYTEFLNAVAKTDATDGLYHWHRPAQYGLPRKGCEIERSGTNGSYSYSVAADRANRPVNAVPWGDALRFANWLHNGQPTGAQGTATTEDGSYYLNGATSQQALMAVTRKPGATWVIPTEDEWYKAAYYNGSAGVYYDYPTGSNTMPDGIDFAGDTTFDAVFWDSGYSEEYANAVTNAGVASPYGTIGQGGNIGEWNETAVYPDVYRGVRGGAWSGNINPLHSGYRESVHPSLAYTNVGFRVASVASFAHLTINIATDSIVENGGNAATTGTVTRSNTDNAAELVVTLTNGDDSEIGIPATVTIPANEASVSFGINAVDDALLDGTQTVTMTASAAGYAAGNRALDVTDHETLTVAINPASISENGGEATGTIARSNADNSQPLTVTLASSDTSEATAPSAVTIPANQASVAFNVTAVEDSLLDGTQTVTITAAAIGYVIGNATVDITDFNHSPTISDIADQTSEEDTPIGVTAFTIGDAETPAGSLTVAASSDNQTLMPNANLVLGGSGANRTITLTPAANQFGVATITLTVFDGMTTAVDILLLTVTAVNDVPVRTAGTLTPITVNENIANVTAVTLGLSGVMYGPGGGSDEAGQAFSYTVTAIPNFMHIFQADGTTQVTVSGTVTAAELQGLKYKTVPDANGTGNLTWTVTDNGTPAQTLTENLAITVTAVNVAPVLGAIGNTSVHEQAALTFNATATDADQPAQTLTFSLDAASLAAGMTIDPATGEFRWTPTKAQGPGSYDVTITVADNGTPALSDSETFAILITGPTWQNSHHACDVNGDGLIQPDDVLALINDINARSSRDLTTAAPPTPTPPPFLDPSGDDEISPVDVLLVINYINSQPIGSGEGEAFPFFAAVFGIERPAPIVPRVPNGHTSVDDDPAEFLWASSRAADDDAKRTQPAGADAVWDEAALEELDAVFAALDVLLELSVTTTGTMP